MQKILVALDGSPREGAVLGAARELAAKTNGRLLLMRAVSLPALPAGSLAVPAAATASLAEELALEHLRGLEEELPESMQGGVRLETGVAWRAICEAARHEDVDLVVIGAHGYGAIERMIGTTAARVVNHCERAVLVVR